MSKATAYRAANILLVEDDREDQWLTRKAFESNHLVNELFIVDDGRKALDFLRNEGAYADSEEYPAPDIILLDLNLPRVDGRTVLKEIKSDPALRRIPVIILTTSAQEEDIIRSYDLGVNSFVSKPVGFEAFMKALAELGHYWLELVILPHRSEN